MKPSLLLLLLASACQGHHGPSAPLPPHLQSSEEDGPHLFANAARAQHALTVIDGGYVCADPVPWHAYVAVNGSDVEGNGSITCPYATPQHAAADVMAAPASQAEYEQPRVVEFIGPGAYTGDITVPALAKAVFIMPVGSVGKIVFSLDSTEQHSSTLSPTVVVIGKGSTLTAVGDGADSIAITSDGTHPVSNATVLARGVTLSGQISMDAATTNGFLTLDDFLSTSTGAYSVHGPGATGITISSATHGKFTKNVDAAKVTILDKVDFFQGPVMVYAGGTSTNLTTTGWRNVGFSSNATTKQLLSGGPVRIDGVSNYNLRTAGWYTYDGGVVQLQEDMSP